MAAPRDLSEEAEQVRRGAATATELFLRNRDRLQKAIRFRLDPRLASRVDVEDVLQEAFIEISRRISDFAEHSTVPFFVWARQITIQVVIDIHRKHLGAARRNVNLEVSISNLASSPANSSVLAFELLGNLTTPSAAAVRNESAEQLRSILQQLPPDDREILMLRHLEGLTNNEAADVLGVHKSAASRRYMRALGKLKEAFDSGAQPDRD